MDENFIYYKTSSPAGDLISFLAGVKKMYERTGRKGVIYQRLNMEGGSYYGAVHPFLNEREHPICMNQYMFDMLKPAILTQEYIEDFLVYDGQKVDFDFDLIRQERFTGQPGGSLNRWFFYVFPEMACDLSKPWFHVEPTNDFSNTVILNFTLRHRNPLIDYSFLRNYEGSLLFVGLPEEYNAFKNEWKLDIEHLKVNNFYELASAIKGCKFFHGNQSFCYQLAEAMKVPRLLEKFVQMPNVVPVGENAFDYYAQLAAQLHFVELFKLNMDEREAS